MIPHWDQHTHTARCQHAIGDAREYVEAAIAIGLERICITDHAPIEDLFACHNRMAAAELAEYHAELISLKDEFAERIEVGVGIEVDWLPHYLPQTRAVIQAYDWDFILGSVHYLCDVTPPQYIIRCGPGVEEHILQRYWSAWRQAVASGFFDSMAHADVYRNSTRQPLPGECKEAEASLRLAADSGVCIEINTSLWRKGADECYPAPWLLTLALEAGCCITLGSDAHHPEQVAADFDRLPALFEQLGDVARHRLRWFRGREALQA